LVQTTEKKLFETPAVYRTIVDAAEEGIWIADTDNVVTFVNKKLVDMLGYPRDEILGKKVFDFTDEKNSAIMKEAIVRSRKGERDTYTVSIRNKSGGQIPLIVATTHMQDEKGRYIGTVQLGSDMTAIKKIEDDLREANARGDMYLDLLSHDIRNMDQVAMGYLEMAMSMLDAGESLTKADMELIEKPLHVLNSSSELINTVMNLKTVKTVGLPMEKTDLCEVVSGVVNSFSGVPDRAININFCPVKDRWVEANYLLKEIFINLIGNAIKHSNGPLDVNININEVTGDGIRYYAVTVEDNGPGIPDEMKSKLFTQPYCEDRKTISKGLGLCLVKALVDIFHGKVRVEDRVPGDYKNGARFVIMLLAVEK
jgi:PAS domain S-box-containing protein